MYGNTLRVANPSCWLLSNKNIHLHCTLHYSRRFIPFSCTKHHRKYVQKEFYFNTRFNAYMLVMLSCIYYAFYCRMVRWHPALYLFEYLVISFWIVFSLERRVTHDLQRRPSALKNSKHIMIPRYGYTLFLMLMDFIHCFNVTLFWLSPFMNHVVVQEFKMFIMNQMLI